MPDSNPIHAMYQLLLEQVQDITKAVKELGDNWHNLNNFVGKLPYELELKFQQAMAKMREEVRKERHDEIIVVEKRVIELEREFKEFKKEFDNKLRLSDKEITVLQVKSGLWGAASGIGTFLALWAMRQI